MRNPKQIVMNKFGVDRRLRPHRIHHFGGFDAAKLHPLAITAFKPDEGGTVSTNISLSLAPVSGLMRSNAYADVIQVFVPYQAIEKLELDTDLDGGVTEMTKRRLLAGQGIGLEAENTISKAAFVHPRSVGGTKMVSKTVRLAYLAAVNHLRRHAYYNATTVAKTETAILPAILGANILERMNGVLEPENLIDGAINLTGDLPVLGIERRGTASTGTDTNLNMYRTPSELTIGSGNGEDIKFQMQAGQSAIYADLSGAGEITLRDMMESRKLDAMIRAFAQHIKDDPQHGEEAVARALYGLSVDYDDNCQVMFKKTYELTPRHHRPTDGPSLNEISAHFEMNENISTVVPRGELGGQLVTLAAVRPLETLVQQPDPHQTESWALVNRVHDELELDEQLLTRADLESGVAAIDEDTPTMWVGHNQLKHDYASQGANEQQTGYVTEMLSAMWLYPVPTSVTPDNINYPATISLYPFQNWNGAEVEYTIKQVAAISTTLAKGPNPVERIQLFADDPTLIENGV